MVYSKRQAKKLAQHLDMPVELGMTYGNPSLQSGFEALIAQGVEEVIVLPLYHNILGQPPQPCLMESQKRLSNCQ